MQWRNINLADSRSEAAKLKHFESGGALAKKGTFVYDQNQTILCRSQAERKFLSLYNIGNGLYRIFTTANRALYFQKKGRSFKKYFFRSLNGAH
jgi:hypothetical protein